MSRIHQDQVTQSVRSLVQEFLQRRLHKIGEDISAYLNVNPFLLSALRDFHHFRTVRDLADFLFISHMASGHATGFGKLIDEKVLPQVFGTIKLSARHREENNLTAAAFDEIDHIVFPNDRKNRCLLSLKASAWTIQNAQAHSLYHSFKQIGDFKLYGKEIVVGVFYGNKSLLTNKYDILRGVNPRQQDQFVTLKHVRVLAGEEFWAWLNDGEKATQQWVLEGTRLASEAVFHQGEHVATVGGGPERLAQELATKYGLEPDAPIDWQRLLAAVNSTPESPK